MKSNWRWLVPIGIAFILLILAGLANGQSVGPSAVVNAPSDLLIKPSDTITRFVVLTWRTYTPPQYQISSVEIWHNYNGGQWSLWKVFTDTFGLYYWEVTFMHDGVYGLQALARDSEGNLEPLSEIAEATFRVDMADVWRDRAYLPLLAKGGPIPTLAPPWAPPTTTPTLAPPNPSTPTPVQGGLKQ